MRSVIFNINIFDDNILELDEEFVFMDITTFKPSSSSIRVITGSPEQTVVIIADNDCKLFVVFQFICTDLLKCSQNL